MKLSDPNLNKMRWLFGHEVARKHPLRTLWRLLTWELIRVLNRPVESKYDETFEITLMPNEGASRLTYYFGVSEPELFSLYDEFLKPGMIIVDAGANIGLHALFFAKRVGSSGSVYAFEPGEVAFKRLQAHVEKNRLLNVHCFHCALGAYAGVISIVENTKDNSRNFVSADTLNADTVNNVVLLPLGQVLTEQGISKVDFLKLDVEGFEPQVLKGVRDYLSKQAIRVLQLELDDCSLARAGSSTADISEMLCHFGYRRAAWDCQNRRFRSTELKSFNTFFVAEQDLM